MRTRHTAHDDHVVGHSPHGHDGPRAGGAKGLDGGRLRAGVGSENGMRPTVFARMNTQRSRSRRQRWAAPRFTSTSRFLPVVAPGASRPCQKGDVHPRPCVVVRDVRVVSRGGDRTERLGDRPGP